MTAPDPGNSPLAALVRSSGAGADTTILVTTRSAQIGQGPRNEIPLDDDSVSSKHALLDFSGSSWRLTDLGSRNGTYVEGERLRPDLPVVLKDGTSIAIGAVKLIFRLQSGLDLGTPRLEAQATPPPPPTPVQSSGFRFPLWLAVLILLVVAVLVFVLTSAGGGQPLSHLTPEVTIEGSTMGIALAPGRWVSV
jgi:pSer/pThr/pTyr-binding forkhead associated (FHA) protein